MPPGPSDKKIEKSYLSSAVDSINPWATSRTTTPTPDNKRDEPAAASGAAAAPGDHSITPLYGQSFRTYPKDCPPLHVQWFHAVDVPKRKPQLVKGRQAPPKDPKPPARPKKFNAFSPSDSRRLEARYQKLLEAAEDNHELESGDSHTAMVQTGGPNKDKSNRSTESGHTSSAANSGIRVQVNEDFLFDVDIEDRELAPVYWLGPVYEARRGTWFFQEGSNLRPCEENLAAQLEEGYLKMKPWLQPVRSRSQSGAKDPSSETPAENSKDTTVATVSSSKPTPEASSKATTTSQPGPQPQPYRLFGAYMSNVATYQDATTAWLSTDGVLSWVTTSVYERFAGGGYMSGVKLIRGYTEPNKAKEKEKDDKVQVPSTQGLPGLDERQQKILKRRSAPPTTRDSTDDVTYTSEAASNEAESRHATLQQQLSSLLESEGKNTAEAEEEIRKRDEQEIQDDYNAQVGETQGREIEHLVLVTHGIGQRLGLRMESVNFVHDVNILRKTIKSVYTNSANLKALNSELGAGPGNCRVQVLPVCWRHLIEFPRQRQKKGEHDLGDIDGEEDDYPSLEDITVEGVAFARSLISDLALDVLLYQSSYREEISRVVVAETNRILRLFREKNPEFKGKIHLMGHSLGSAIFFDVLCRQREHSDEIRHPLRFWPSQNRQESKLKDHELQFDFDVHDFFCLGSPVGLFQMLKGRTIAARHTPHALPSESPLQPDETDDPFLTAPAASTGDEISPVSGLPYSISSPKVAQLFNIFHPSDPVSYRMEPLISSAMATLKPQLLPYTKRGIFGNVAPQGLTGIGAKVGQSVSGLWSSLSAGIASNLLNRSLGLTNEEVARLAAEQHLPGVENRPPQNADSEEKTDERKRQLADLTTAGHQNVTLIDDEFETLFSTFQKKRETLSQEDEATKANEEGRKARKLRAEETKVRALNRNGRVDYSIQESALDFNPINTIASHMSYWAEEDVNHFVLSQLLSNRMKRKRGAIEGLSQDD
ncbi:Putative phospholipase C20G8.02, mitochondrial [Tolypocladium paradoxum]|uniref:Phospholipase C20G8.02, mitochondrial n=1 Tax=Tolypocladium paradoxum TaxID=94208 RepID=A0A2S4L8J9_9HYPO|nr:Putative phospholipase C20G8.02, mitochondrial [Tolypocladium paradoxum]